MSTQPEPTVLITRPEPKATELAQSLIPDGLSPILSPLLAFAPLPGPETFMEDEVVVFTSANAVRGAAARGLNTKARAYVVGPDTAAAAREVGLTDIRQGDEDVRALARLIRAERVPRLTYARAPQVATNLPRLLQGVTEVREVMVYRMVPAGSFSPAAMKLLESGALTLATFYSPRTARTFVKLLKSCDGPRISNTIALSISHETAKSLHTLGFKENRVATRADGASMSRAIRRCCGCD